LKYLALFLEDYAYVKRLKVVEEIANADFVNIDIEIKEHLRKMNQSFQLNYIFFVKN